MSFLVREEMDSPSMRLKVEECKNWDGFSGILVKQILRLSGIIPRKSLFCASDKLPKHPGRLYLQQLQKRFHSL